MNQHAGFDRKAFPFQTSPFSLQETEYILLKGTKGKRHWLEDIIESIEKDLSKSCSSLQTEFRLKFTVYRDNSVSPGTLLNYALKIQCTFTSPRHRYTSLNKYLNYLLN
ncbi:hypothetical protein V1477_001482 [Vespula maculifrons]|uniref:Uncharacterized protein n=1 Tax=Vespula maculifrons TaxID=7453 RepID=A0ABD2CYS1_VESMC